MIFSRYKAYCRTTDWRRSIDSQSLLKKRIYLPSSNHAELVLTNDLHQVFLIGLRNGWRNFSRE